MGLGLQGTYGVAGGQRALEEILAERAAQAELQRKAAIDAAKFAEDRRQFDAKLGVDQSRLGLDRDKFGLDVRQWDEAAPNREAGRLYTTAQTSELQRRPTAEEQERQHDLALIGAREASEGRLMTRRADEAIRQREATAAPGADGQASPYTSERVARTRQAVGELVGKVNRWTTGLGSMLAAIPETDARDFAAQLDTLKGNIAFNELAQMREASKTGGALGQVSERELALLSSVLGALDPGQSPENLRQQLEKIDASLARWEAAQAGLAQPGRTGDGAGSGTRRRYNPATGRIE